MVTYASESWVLKEDIKQKLSIFERAILRRIFDPNKNSDGMCRIKTNNELNELINKENIINHIKSLRLGWFGHINRMSEQSLVRKEF